MRPTSLAAPLIALYAACACAPSEQPVEPAREIVAAPPAAMVAAPRPAPEIAAPQAPADRRKYARAVVRNNLELAFVDAIGADNGPALAQVVKRVLVWWVNPRTDLRKGDVVEVVYEIEPAESPIAEAVWFHSTKQHKTYEAVLFKPKGQRFARWFLADGAEVERRLVGGPMDDYEQVTALLSDGRGHRGVDFKAPVGTPVKAPFAGRVARVNWSTRRNGLCIDLERKNGQRAFLLHLSKIEPGIRAGVRVRAGQRLARSGNSGRSSAPHLHYQLQAGQKARILNPFKIHRTRQVRVAKEELPRLRARLAKLATMRARSS